MTRRILLQAVPAGLLAGCSGNGRAAAPRGAVAPDGAVAPTGPLPTTPACADADDPTPPLTEGPYFTPGSPETVELRTPGMSGTPLSLSGFVVDVNCRPIFGALLDFWQADDAGSYDNAGFRLRGHQRTSSDGRYRLETIVPGLYTGRTRHIHVKAQAPGGPVLTTQLFFPGEPRNRDDGIFDEDLVIQMRGTAASFTFVLATTP